MTKPRCAFLVYPSWRQARRKDQSFDGLSNIGAHMVLDAARRGGIEIGFCTPDSASGFDIVLVSLTSNYDVLAFAHSVMRLQGWKSRKFKVLAGGFGMQNPYPIQEHIDFAWFGRCENEIVWLLSNRCDVDHPSLMDMRKFRICKINQATIYPHTFSLSTKVHGEEFFQEKMMGCPNKCFYCHFSWARRHIKTGNHYDVSMYGSSQEIDMFNVDAYDPTKGKITVGLDGYSERLRKIMNRKNSNQDFINFVEGVSQKTEVKGKAVFLKLYNIIGQESEADTDYKEFCDLLPGLRLKKRIVGIVHSTPLHPSPCTPVAYSAVNIDADARKYTGKPIIDKPLINFFHSPYQESSWGLIESLVVERGQASTHGIFIDVVFNKKLKTLKSKQKIAAISRKHDIEPLIRAYGVDEQLPTWFLEGYTPQDSIRRMRRVMLKRVGAC
jgi:hypothetical protein